MKMIMMVITVSYIGVYKKPLGKSRFVHYLVRKTTLDAMYTSNVMEMRIRKKTTSMNSSRPQNSILSCTFLPDIMTYLSLFKTTAFGEIIINVNLFKTEIYP